MEVCASADKFAGQAAGIFPDMSPPPVCPSPNPSVRCTQAPWWACGISWAPGTSLQSRLPSVTARRTPSSWVGSNPFPSAARPHAVSTWVKPRTGLQHCLTQSIHRSQELSQRRASSRVPARRARPSASATVLQSGRCMLAAVSGDPPRASISPTTTSLCECAAARSSAKCRALASRLFGHS